MSTDFGHINIQDYYINADKIKERKETFFYFEDKYVKNPFDNYFIIEETSRFIAQKFKFFLPGSIYTFKYDPIYKDVLDFYDTRPMSLITKTFVAKETKNVIVQGLNLNFIPEVQKVQLLNSFYKVFRNDLLNAERESDSGLISQAKNLAKYLENWSFMTTVFVNQSKIPLNFIVRNYEISRILNPVLVELEDWCVVPFYIPKEIQKVGLNKVYEEYITAKMKVVNRKKFK
jgi:hypothetical protein